MQYKRPVCSCSVCFSSDCCSCELAVVCSLSVCSSLSAACLYSSDASPLSLNWSFSATDSRYTPQYYKNWYVCMLVSALCVVEEWQSIRANLLQHYTGLLVIIRGSCRGIDASKILIYLEVCHLWAINLFRRRQYYNFFINAINLCTWSNTNKRSNRQVHVSTENIKGSS